MNYSDLVRIQRLAAESFNENYAGIGKKAKASDVFVSMHAEKSSISISVSVVINGREYIVDEVDSSSFDQGIDDLISALERAARGQVER